MYNNSLAFGLFYIIDQSFVVSVSTFNNYHPSTCLLSVGGNDAFLYAQTCGKNITLHTSSDSKASQIDALLIFWYPTNNCYLVVKWWLAGFYIDSSTNTLSAFGNWQDDTCQPSVGTGVRIAYNQCNKFVYGTQNDQVIQICYWGLQK